VTNSLTAVGAVRFGSPLDPAPQPARAVRTPTETTAAAQCRAQIAGIAEAFHENRALTFYSGSEPIVHGKSRVAGVTLHATDTDLRLGSGPEAAGSVLSLLLVASGRGAVLDELSGPGVDLLRSRL
jgi:hypothetical protein